MCCNLRNVCCVFPGACSKLRFDYDLPRIKRVAEFGDAISSAYRLLVDTRSLVTDACP